MSEPEKHVLPSKPKKFTKDCPCPECVANELHQHRLVATASMSEVSDKPIKL